MGSSTDDLLEAALEGGVLLEVLAVLVERGGADGLQLATGQHRLEDRRGVDGALGGTGTHEGVQLVDEQDDVAAGADLLEHLLQALLEVAAVAGAGHERAEVERVELLALQRLGHVVGHDLLGQALDDGRLADAGLADEHRVVLGAARQHLHHALDLAARPMTGSSFFSRASWVRLRPNWSSTSEPEDACSWPEPAGPAACPAFSEEPPGPW